MEPYTLPSLVILFLVLACGCLVPTTQPFMNESPPPPDSPNLTAGARVIAMAVQADEIETSYPEARDLLIEGLTYNANGGRYLEAIECYDRALAIDPDFTIAWEAKGVSLHNLGRYDGAIACYKEALSLDPANEGIESLIKLALEDRARTGGS